ncbi:MAG: hypothetical protein KAS32_24840 [Candidatus Peribacteraceae bacterium]|nr:hypothetical protein [Candidatus Peribacteraceae bacterium]
MKVLAINPTKQAIDFLAETACSYGCEEFQVVSNARLPSYSIPVTQLDSVAGVINPILLVQRGGVDHRVAEIAENATLVVGPDNGHGEWEQLFSGAPRVCVATPVDYHLWSFIALALVLDNLK